MRLLALCTLLASTASHSLHAQDITLQLRWLHQAQFAGYYMAQEKGFYQQAGLNVTILPADPNNPHPMEQVLNGQADFGVGNAGLVAAYLKGQPLVALAAIFQRSPNVWLTLTSSPIYNLTDLAQSRLMMTRSLENAELLAMFHKAGIQIEKLNITPSSFNLQDLTSGRTDAFNAYITNEPFYLDQQHIGYRVFDPQSYGIDFYSDVLFTRKELIENRPETVEAFRIASIKGWQYMIEHIDETQKVISEKYNQQNKSPEHITYELYTVRQIIIPELIQLGHMNPERWHTIAATFQQLSLIPNGPVNLDGFLYTPREDIDLSQYYWIISILTASLLLALSISMVLRRLNLRLQTQIQATERAQNRFQRERDHLQTTLANITDGVLTINHDLSIQAANQSACTLLGRDIDTLINHNITSLSLIDLHQNKLINPRNCQTGTPLQGDATYQHPSTGQRILHYSCVAIDPHQNHERYVIALQDITQHYNALHEANWQATHDTLTGLPNRLLLQDRLKQSIANAKRNQTQVAIAFLDLDGFKPVNDTYGHATGDKLLIEVAKRLQELIRDSDTIARLGGDEFVILLGCLPEQEITNIANRIITRLGQPFIINDTPIHIGASMGISLFPQTHQDADILLRQADIAMYKAKQQGRNQWCFSDNEQCHQPSV